MEIEKNKCSTQQDKDTMPENNSDKDYDLMREYSNQLNREIENKE